MNNVRYDYTATRGSWFSKRKQFVCSGKVYSDKRREWGVQMGAFFYLKARFIIDRINFNLCLTAVVWSCRHSLFLCEGQFNTIYNSVVFHSHFCFDIFHHFKKCVILVYFSTCWGVKLQQLSFTVCCVDYMWCDRSFQCQSVITAEFNDSFVLKQR